MRQKQGGPIQIDIMYNKTQKDIGVLIKLNSLMKRLELIKFMQGNWKPTNKKYLNMTEQISYVKTRLQLLNEAKIQHMQRRAQALSQEVEEIRQIYSKNNDPANEKLMAKYQEMSHDRELIDSLHNNAKRVKAISE